MQDGYQKESFASHLSASGVALGSCAKVELPMVKTGQGLVLGATMGSRPPLQFFLAEGPASGSLRRFACCWTL